MTSVGVFFALPVAAAQSRPRASKSTGGWAAARMVARRGGGTTTGAGAGRAADGVKALRRSKGLAVGAAKASMAAVRRATAEAFARVADAGDDEVQALLCGGEETMRGKVARRPAAETGVAGDTAWLAMNAC